MLNTFELPQYILGQYPHEKITHLKLQKLLYYVKVWGIVAGVELYQGEFKKWERGPVNIEVYHKYKSFGRDPIMQEPDTGQPNLDGLEKELTDFIVSSYIPISAISLSAMTHKESPWIDTPQNSVISHDKILKFYSQQPFAKNFNPFDVANKSYFVVQSNSWHAYTLDMTVDDMERNAQFSSFKDYLALSTQAQVDVEKLISSLPQF